MNFQHLLLDGEINLNILNKIMKHIGYIQSLEYKSCNGLSFVFISEENVNVFQYYNYESVCIKIKNIFDNLARENLINKKIYFKKVIYNLNFNIFNFLANFIEYKNEDNIIVWEKHLCLNSFSKEKLTDILVNNIIKILWDISNGLYGLHFNLILHGDPRVDNIGIKNNKFVSIEIWEKCFFVPLNKLYIKDEQIYVLKNEGIMQILEKNIYTVSIKSDIIVKIKLV